MDCFHLTFVESTVIFKGCCIQKLQNDLSSYFPPQVCLTLFKHMFLKYFHILHKISLKRLNFKILVLGHILSLVVLLLFALSRFPQIFGAIYSSVKCNWSFMTINYVKKSTPRAGSCLHKHNLALSLSSLEDHCSGVKQLFLPRTDWPPFMSHV